jgi:hypothetical protein
MDGNLYNNVNEAPMKNSRRGLHPSFMACGLECLVGPSSTMTTTTPRLAALIVALLTGAAAADG